ncbi:hypothetical protein AMAG_14598 [Allomyces macrogynus ATCC 38327]|uniref:Cytochrome b5 heme-binding domain-containing protein n=1 Tax=Allomyces macrogynus (strain ATCC 38327) TaxID=578462 RepID=A0A0L0T6X1_ALLM3|nr:hypothetical protein AMAG_14598 [Allomyces macrogynus ATCC 38327]|eukprot:KNE70472.1 hypothetical protein AMAG_14598 [Allomyces macrogynus ATCC 38327]
MASPRVFSAADVAKHNTTTDLWTIIHGKVYDITKMQDEHPGGGEVLLDTAGADSTEAFEDVGHGDSAREWLKDFYLGELVSDEEAAEAKAKAPAASKCCSSWWTWAVPAVALAAAAAFAIRHYKH